MVNLSAECCFNGELLSGFSVSILPYYQQHITTSNRGQSHLLAFYCLSLRVRFVAYILLLQNQKPTATKYFISEWNIAATVEITQTAKPMTNLSGHIKRSEGYVTVIAANRIYSISRAQRMVLSLSRSEANSRRCAQFLSSR